jgi:hypothetical protein
MGGVVKNTVFIFPGTPISERGEAPLKNRVCQDISVLREVVIVKLLLDGVKIDIDFVGRLVVVTVVRVIIRHLEINPDVPIAIIAQMTQNQRVPSVVIIPILIFGE